MPGALFQEYPAREGVFDKTKIDGPSPTITSAPGGTSRKNTQSPESISFSTGGSRLKGSFIATYTEHLKMKNPFTTYQPRTSLDKSRPWLGHNSSLIVSDQCQSLLLISTQLNLQTVKAGF